MQRSIISKIYRFLTIFLCFSVFAACTSFRNDSKVLVTIGDEVITVDEFNHFLLQIYQSPARVDTLSEAEKAEVLDQLIENHLILAAAKSQGLEHEPQLQFEIERYRKKAIFDRLIERVVVDSILNPAKLKEFYDKYGGEIRIQELLVKAPLSRFFKSPTDSLLDAEAQQIAQSLYLQVASGEAFASVAAQFSQNRDVPVPIRYKTTGYTRWGRMSKEIQQAAFQLEEGEVSRPIRTGFGYHIIKLLEKKKRSFEAEKEAIKHQLAAVYARTIQEYKERFLQRLEKKYRIFINYENIDRLANMLDAEPAGADLTEQRIGKIQLASYSGGEILTDQFFEVMRGKTQNFKKNKSKIKTWTTQATLMAVAELEARNYGIDVQNDVIAFRDNLLIQTMRRRAVPNWIRVSEEEMRDYYERHRSELSAPLLIHVREVLVQESYLAEHIKRLVMSGKDFGQLADEHTIRIEARGKGGDLGFVSAEVHPEIFEAVRGVAVGAIHGPFQTDRGLSIVQVLEKRMGEPPPFEKIRDKIYHQVKMEKQTQRYNEWLTALAAQYPPQFHWDYLPSKYQKLSKYVHADIQFELNLTEM